MTIMSNAEWTASSNSSWCTISPVSGNGTKKVQVMIEACATTQERSAVITVATDGSKSTNTTINVTQGARNGILLVSPKEITVGNEAASVAFAVSSNTDWTVSSVASWATVDKTTGNGNGIVKVTIAENTSHSEDRTGNIVVIAGEGDERIMEDVSIKQLSSGIAVLNVTSSGTSFKAEGGSVTVPVITNITGDVSATSDFEWCDASYSDGVVTITASPNTDNSSRICIVNVYGVVKGTTVCKQIQVYQAGLGDPELTILKSNVSLGSFSGSQSNQTQSVVVGYIPVSEGISVSVDDEYPSWITNMSVNETGHMITFDVQPNASADSRSAVLGIIAKLGEETMVYPVSVYQEGVGSYTVTISSSSLSIGADGGGLSTDLFVNAAQAYVSAYVAEGSWATVECTSGANSFGINASLKVSVAANTGAYARTTTILVPAKVGDQMVYGAISLIQAGVSAPDVEALSNSIILPHEGTTAGNGYFVALTGANGNTSISAVVPVSWLSVKFSDDKDTVSFMASANMSSSSRFTQITVVATRGGETQLIPIDVTQSGTGSAELLVAENYYTFDQAGGTYVIPVEAMNGSGYEVIGTPDWIATASCSSPASIKATVASNPDADSRSGDIIILAKNGDDYAYYVINTLQKGLEAPSITLGQNEIIIPGTATSGTEGYTVTVTGADASTTLDVSSDQPWVKGIVNSSKNSIALAAEENTASGKRTATISVVAMRGGEQQIVSFEVVQPGKGSAELRIAVTSYTFGPKAVNPFEIPVTAVGTTTYAVASNPDWITVSDDGTAVMKISVASNESTTDSRSGVIILKAVNGSDETQYCISVKQLGMNGPNVTAAVASITVPNAAITCTEGYDVALTGVDAATSLTTSSTADWIEGIITDAGNLSFSTQENTSSNKRTAVVSVIAQRAGEQQVISVLVTQPGKGDAQLILALTTYTFSYKAVTDFVIPITMVSGTRYSVVAAPSWMSIDNAGTTAMKISIPENEVTDLRKGTIIMRACNGDDETEYTISVTQLGMNGPDVSLAYDTIVLPANPVTIADGYYIPMSGVDAETQVVFTYQYDWAIPYFSTDYDRIIFSTYENTSASKREGKISVLATKGGQTQILNFHVIQLGTGSAALELSGNDYQFGHDAVTLFEIPVIKDNGTNWTYYSCPSWITTAGEGGDEVQISLTANDATGDTRTGDIILKATNGDDITFYTISITQFGIDGPDVTVLQTTLTLPMDEIYDYYGYAFDLSGIDAATTVTIDITQETQWLMAQVVDDQIQVMADRNRDEESRTALITVKAVKGDETQYIYNLKVIQLGSGDPALVFACRDYSIAWNTHEILIPLLTLNSATPEFYYDMHYNYEYVNDPDGAVSYAYLIHPNQGTNIYYLRVEFNENRTVSPKKIQLLIFSHNETVSINSYNIKITQGSADGPVASPVVDMVTLPNAAGSSALVPVEGLNTSPETSLTLDADDHDWFDLSYNSGWVTVTATTVNPGESSRSGIFSIIATRSGETAVSKVTVTQPGSGGIYFATDQTTYSASQAADTITAHYVSNALTTATVVSVPDWITAPVADAAYSYDSDGEGEIGIAVAANNTTSERTGYILMSLTNGDDQSFYKIGIVQPGTDGPEAVLLCDFVQMPYAGVTGDDYTVNFEGVEASTTVTPYSSVDWLTIKSANGNTAEGTYQIVLNATANNHADSRDGQVGILVEKNGQYQYFTVDVTQLGTGSPYLLMDKSDFYLDYEEQNPLINIYPSLNTTVSVYEQPNESWVSNISVGEGTLAFHVDENLDEYPRNAFFVLSIKRGDEIVYQTVHVYQSAKTAPYLELPSGMTYFPPSGTGLTQTFSISSMKNVNMVRVQSVDCQSYDGSSTTTWLSVTPSAIENITDGSTITLTLNASQNYGSGVRSGTIVLEYGNELEVEKTEFNVVQNGVGSPVADFANLEYYLDWSDQDVTAYMTDANGTFTVSSDASWINNVNYVSANKEVTFHVDANGTEYPRSSYVLVKVVNGDETIYRTIRVFQGCKTAPYLQLGAGSLEFSSSAVDSTTLSSISSNVKRIEVLSNSGSGWLSVDPPLDDDLSDGSHTIYLSMSENTSAESRSALVVLEYGNDLEVEQTAFRVTQDGVGSPTYDFYSTEFHLDYSSQTVYAYANGDASSYIATSRASWIGFSGTPSSSGLAFTVDENDTSYPRTGYFVLEASNGGETIYRTVQVYQGARTAPYLNFTTNSVFLDQAASATLNVDASTRNVTRARIQSNSGADWLSATLSKETINPDESISDFLRLETSSANTGADDRTATIVIEYGNDLDVEQAVFTVTQSGMGELSISMISYEFIQDPSNTYGTSIPVAVSPSNGSLIMETIYWEGSTDWMNCHLTAFHTGSYNYIFSFWPSENHTGYTRTGYILLKATLGDQIVRRTVSITQYSY
jgi:hypothetical protein